MIRLDFFRRFLIKFWSRIFRERDFKVFNI